MLFIDSFYSVSYKAKWYACHCRYSHFNRNTCSYVHSWNYLINHVGADRCIKQCCYRPAINVYISTKKKKNNCFWHGWVIMIRALDCQGASKSQVTRCVWPRNTEGGWMPSLQSTQSKLITRPWVHIVWAIDETQYEWIKLQAQHKGRFRPLVTYSIRAPNPLVVYNVSQVSTTPLPLTVRGLPCTLVFKKWGDHHDP